MNNAILRIKKLLYVFNLSGLQETIGLYLLRKSLPEGNYLVYNNQKKLILKPAAVLKTNKMARKIIEELATNERRTTSNFIETHFYHIGLEKGIIKKTIGGPPESNILQH